MATNSAAKQLLGLGGKNLFAAVSEGIELLVSNVVRLHEAASKLSDGGDQISAAILGSIATEEAAKVLILLDVVRCPEARQEERKRTLACWDDHVWKGIYAEACNGKLQHGSFGDVERFVESESSHFYLDGPAGYEWIFPNRILDERESRMYVDYMRDITQRPGEKPWWSGPSVYEAKYKPSPCACVVDVLANAGLGTVEGLEVVARTWRAFEPLSQTSSAELHSRVQEMWQQLEAKGLCEDGLSANHLTNYFYRWPFPLWSVAPKGRERLERTQQLAEVKRERRDRIEELRKIEEIRDPPPSIADDEVRMLQDAFDTYYEDLRRHEDNFGAHSPSGGLRIIPGGIPDYDEEAAPYRKLKGLWGALRTEDRISLNALALFARGEVANWRYAYKHAAIVDKRNDERYQMGLGGEWLNGLRRYQAPPPRRS